MRRDVRAQWAFTLIELLVAVAIAAGLAAMVLVVTSTVLRVWQRAQDRFSTQGQAQLALDLLQRDLQAAVFRSDGRTWLAVDVIDAADALVSHGWQTSGRIKPAAGVGLGGGSVPNVGAARFGRSGAWLRFVATNVEANTGSGALGSLPTVISYQIARRPVNGPIAASNRAPTRYTLYRSAVAAEITWLQGPDVLAAEYGSTLAKPAETRSARSVTNPSSSDALAANVVDFGVWLYTRGADGELQRMFPAIEGDVSHHAHSSAEYPVAADAMVRVLTDEGAVRLAQIENGGAKVARPAGVASDVEWWWNVVEAHSQVYVRRIEILAEGP